MSYVREVLVDITANVGQQNVDELLRQAEQMLTDIRRRDFSQNTHEVQEELARAIEGTAVCLSVCLSHNTHEVQEELARAIEGTAVCLSVCLSVTQHSRSTGGTGQGY